MNTSFESDQFKKEAPPQAPPEEVEQKIIPIPAGVLLNPNPDGSYGFASADGRYDYIGHRHSAAPKPKE